MENAGVKQARLLADLWTQRADLVEKLNDLDGQIGQVSAGAVPAVAVATAPTERPSKKTTVKRNGHVRNGAKKRGPGRPKGSKNKPKTEDAPAPAPVAPAPAPVEAETPASAAEMTASGKRFRNQISLKELICQVIGPHENGIKLESLVQECYNAGYRSTSDRKGFVQNIRTNLNTLMNDGVVTKDDEKRYRVAAA